MWVLLGPFDGEAGDAGFQSMRLSCNLVITFLIYIQEPKLLKPNTSYTVGRKDRPLLINNKKISHDHCDFVVGPHLVEDVVSTRPFVIGDLADASAEQTSFTTYPQTYQLEQEG
jgi:hypothetical protein